MLINGNRLFTLSNIAVVWVAYNRFSIKNGWISNCIVLGISYKISYRKVSKSKKFITHIGKTCNLFKKLFSGTPIYWLFQPCIVIFFVLSYQKLKEKSKTHTLMPNLSLRINSQNKETICMTKSPKIIFLWSYR